MDKKKLDQQSQHWEKNFSSKPEMFGNEPSIAAVQSLNLFKGKKIVELGAGLGRDTIFFAQNSIQVEALDYSQKAIEIISNKSKKLNLSQFIKTKVCDVRKRLPFDSSSIDGCFSHMLYCMALSNYDLENLNKEILRILKPRGINIYTVRNTDDGDYKNGTHIGEDLYENDGFIVHFFSEKKIKSLTNGFDILEIKKFEEGTFPRKLFKVILKKNIT